MTKLTATFSTPVSARPTAASVRRILTRVLKGIIVTEPPFIYLFRLCRERAYILFLQVRVVRSEVYIEMRIKNERAARGGGTNQSVLGYLCVSLCLRRTKIDQNDDNDDVWPIRFMTKIVGRWSPSQAKPDSGTTLKQKEARACFTSSLSRSFCPCPCHPPLSLGPLRVEHGHHNAAQLTR